MSWVNSPIDRMDILDWMEAIDQMDIIHQMEIIYWMSRQSDEYLARSYENVQLLDKSLIWCELVGLIDWQLLNNEDYSIIIVTILCGVHQFGLRVIVWAMVLSIDGESAFYYYYKLIEAPRHTSKHYND